MPELPEVEVVRSVLDSSIKGLTISKIDLLYSKIIDNDFDFFNNKVLNKKIIRIDRYAKYLIFILEDGAFLSHLRMEGKYFYLPEEQENLKHVHVVFHFDNGYKLMYQDVRKFGRIEYKDLNDIYTTPPLNKIGVEANNSKYDLELIYNRIISKKLPIKSVLLDQSIISGLGNIYVDEVLFKSAINPNRLSNTISLEEVKLILNNSKEILDLAIINKGTTIRSYTSSLGVTGNYQNYLLVHTKNICPNCQCKLEKTKIGGRTSYYCLKCQR